MSFACQPFLDVIKDASGGNTKTQQKEYLNSGRYPIVDQGKDLIGGYTDDASRLCKVEPPVIVFGDHTRAVKYIDFPFAMGADGTKILVPKKGDDSRYLYHAIRAIKIEEAGYSRHFKFLKEAQIPLPPLEEQKRIAKILDAADALRAKRRNTLAQLDALLQSAFLELFGDPVLNDKNWDVMRLGNLLEDIESGWSPKCLDRKAGDDEWGVLKLGAVTKCFYDDREQKALPEHVEPRPRIEVCEGDLLFSRKNTRELVCATAYVCETRRKLMIPDLIFRLRIKDKISVSAVFLWQLLVNPRQRMVIQSLAGGAAGSMPNISKAKLKEVLLIQPPVELQRKYSKVVHGIEAEKNRARAHLEELDLLCFSLQQRAFSGEL